MIKIGDNPEDEPKINKFIAKSGDGMRGLILARTKKYKQAVILALNSSIKGDVEWGKLYLVKEVKQDEYPRVIAQINGIPNTKNWIFEGK